MAKIIEANNLTKIYGEKETSVTALDDINIEFRENEFTAIMDPLDQENPRFFTVLQD